MNTELRTCQAESTPARTLIFIHGWGGQGAFWQPQLDYFSASHPVVAPDLPGHGENADAGVERPGIAAFAGHVANMIEQAGWQDSVLVGHSMGGIVALEAAGRVPDKVAAVVMVDSFVMDWGRLDDASIEGFLAGFRQDFVAATRALIEQTCTERTDPALIEATAQVMCRFSPDVGLPALESMLRWDSLPTLRSLPRPVHCINGALVDAVARERYAPHVVEHAVPQGGHYLQMEDPAGFNRLLEGILEAVG